MNTIDLNNKRKFPRTQHFPWSQTISSDDKVLKSTSHFEGEIVSIGIKYDGESTSMYPDYMHARSINSKHNFTRDWAKRFHSIFKYHIPEGWIFSFENLAYCHSIFYDDLESFCYLLNIWDEKGFCLSQNDVENLAKDLDLAMPRIIYQGVYDEKIISELHKDLKIIDLDKDEGYVMRTVKPFHYSDYSKNVAKFVRANHVQPNQDGKEEHWLKKTYPNKLSTTKPIKPFYMA